MTHDSDRTRQTIGLHRFLGGVGRGCVDAMVGLGWDGRVVKVWCGGLAMSVGGKLK